MDERESTGGVSPVMRRTAVFLLAGAGMLVLGAAVQPRFKTAKVESEEQRVLFPELSDASKAASLEIVSYDDELSTLHPFKVMQSGGVWVLPAHQNYPADAKDQLAAAATALVDLKMLDVVSKSPAEHETYGVIEPDPEKIKPGMTGVGQLIEIRDASGNKLARLIVGKEDKRRSGEDAAGRALRFVRKAGQDPVYRVEIDTSKLTTKFDDWIEKDLLKLSPWDVRRLTLEDYALVAVESVGTAVEMTAETAAETASPPCPAMAASSICSLPRLRSQPILAPSPGLLRRWRCSRMKRGGSPPQAGYCWVSTRSAAQASSSSGWSAGRCGLAASAQSLSSTNCAAASRLAKWCRCR